MAGTLNVTTLSGISTLNAPSGVLATQNGMTGIAKAWVNFNGTGTVAINGSFNVSSITDNGTGDYTVNFTTAMPNANYNFVFGTQGNFAIQYNITAPTTTAIRVGVVDRGSGSLVDNAAVCVSIFSS
jgi:hypothetical protein